VLSGPLIVQTGTRNTLLEDSRKIIQVARDGNVVRKR
jgi:hypothetical protein